LNGAARQLFPECQGLRLDEIEPLFDPLHAAVQINPPLIGID